jgi:hypothetical protein
MNLHETPNEIDLMRYTLNEIDLMRSTEAVCPRPAKRQSG